MDEIRSRDSLSYRTLCRCSPAAYPSVMRWKGRMRRGELVLMKPGPKKVEPFDLDALRIEVEALSHCRKRTHGTGKLYQRYADSISRRDLQEMISSERIRVNWERRGSVKHLAWNVPCVVWAIDDTEDSEMIDGKISLNAVRDMASRYELPPAVSERILHGEEVAEHLEELFKEYGPPLFLKRDNGGNLNHNAVDQVLSKHLVIPLNSPVRYPQYNGCRERGQDEMKTYMRSRLPFPESARLQHIRSLAVHAAHILNHRSKRSLAGRTPCEMFSQGRPAMKQYDRRKRKEVYDWIRDTAMAIMERLDGDGPKAFQKAWRTACEIWLQRSGVLTVSVQGKVLPEKLAEMVS